MAKSLSALLATGLAAGALGCAPKLYFDQTFRYREELKVTEKGYASLSSAETFDLGPIRKLEAKFDRVQITKLHGSFFLVADGFKNLWRLWADGTDAAAYKKVDLGLTRPLESPTLEVAEKCVVLGFTSGGVAEKRWITAGGKVDKKGCPDV
jgi:hypothetical protein